MKNSREFSGKSIAKPGMLPYNNNVTTDMGPVGGTND